ncbi:methyltransferase domain-containing protein [Eubacteriales bacterium OttesenSCG-928-G02]|nr:methyltransferase domain-containing protein [Eubacteriales bacterium OttesenSCG-928-G02]
MTTFIYGTGNPAKLQSMRDCLASLKINIIGLKEIGIDIPNVEENGNTPLENARIKALDYYKAIKRPVFACDSGLYIDGLSDDEQPGVHVRMRNGKRLNDDEMIEHYAAIANRLGGKAVARYKNAICFVVSESEIYEHFGDDISGDTFCFVDKPHPKRIEGFPLDCLSVHIESGEYYYWHRPGGDVGMMNKGFQEFFGKVLAQREMVRHYDALIDENNDPVYDPVPLREHMDKWDGAPFIEALQLAPEKSVLEIGVGTGRLAVRVSDKCKSFTGIDISPKTIERAKENLQGFQNVCLIHGDFLTHIFDKEFDVIYSSLTFMHIKNKQSAIQKVASLLIPYGRFVLSISKDRKKTLDFGNRQVEVYSDTPDEITALMTEAGLEIEKQFETEYAVIFVARKET